MGAAEAKLFAREGAKVVIGDVLEKEGRETEAEIRKAGREAVFLRMDVTEAADWQKAIDLAVSRYGKLNVLVNNAGIIDRSELLDTSEETWDRVLGVNAKGIFLGCKLCVPPMLKSGGGSIINISSVSGMVSIGYPAYNSSKGAVRALTKNLAVTYAKKGIRINSIHPGSIWTHMSVTGINRTRDERAETIPMGRVGEPEEVAYGALFLASDESSYITGTELVIDGGLTAE